MRSLAIAVALSSVVACGGPRVGNTPIAGSPIGPTSIEGPLGAASTQAVGAASDPAPSAFGRCLNGGGPVDCFSQAQLRSVGITVWASLTAPGAPTNLVALASGSAVTMAWSAPSGGDAATTFVIEAGSAPGLSNLASISTGTTATSFSTSGVGAGTYYVRVRAANGGGVSAASNEAILVVSGGGCTTPGVPSLALIVNSGGTVGFSWTIASGNPTSYVLEAGSAPGTTNLANSDLGTPATAHTATGVGAGTYYVRVRARNACGTSGPSNEVVLVVGGTPAPRPPAPPTVRIPISDTVSVFGYNGHSFAVPLTGRLTATLSWSDSAVDLDLYLTSATCVRYPPGNCTILARSVDVNTRSEQVSWTVRSGDRYAVWVDNFSTIRSQSYSIDLAFASSSLTGESVSTPSVTTRAETVRVAQKPDDAEKIP